MKKAAAFAGAIVLVSCAPVDEPSKSVAAVEPAVTVIGEAKGCLSAGSIQNTQVRGNGVIDFTVTGGKVYRNYLANGCPVLRNGDAITYEVKGGTPYGASTIADGDGSRQPSKPELDGAHYLGKRVAQTAAKLHG